MSHKGLLCPYCHCKTETRKTTPLVGSIKRWHRCNNRECPWLLKTTKGWRRTSYERFHDSDGSTNIPGLPVTSLPPKTSRILNLTLRFDD